MKIKNNENDQRKEDKLLRQSKMTALKGKFNSIKAKVIALLLLALLALVVSGVFALQQAGRIQEQQLFGTLEDKAIANAYVVEREMEIEVRSLFTISQSPILQDEDIYVSLAFLDNLLEEKEKEDSKIITIGLIDMAGYLWEAADPEHVTYRGDEGWFQAVRNGATLAFSAPGFSAAFPDLMRVVVVRPVFKDGQLYRVLHARLGLNHLVELMEELKFGEKGRTFVVDGHGIFVAHPMEELLLQSFTKEGEFIATEIAAYGRQVVADKSGQIEYTFRGIDSILNFQPIPLTNWIVVTVAERGEFFAPMQTLTHNLVMLIAGTALLLLLAGWYLAGKITRPLRSLATAAGRLGEGDLGTAITAESSDETGQLAAAFEQMRLSLQKLINDTAAASAKVAETAQSLMTQAEHTATAATENAASVNEISATMGSVADNVQTVSEQATATSDQADRGQENINTLTLTMQETEQAAQKATVSVQDLSTSITAVGEFVTVINDIAGQTNLLALNAAIEAARAGEAGKGFAVVAEEVRKLAENSARSTEEISNIIVEIQQHSKQATADMEDSQEKIVRGNQAVQEANQSFGTILSLVQDLKQKVDEVAAATGEVSEASQNVAAATEEQTAVMQEVSASAAELNNISSKLDDILNEFR